MWRLQPRFECEEALSLSSLHLIVKHEWHNEPNWKEKESQPYYRVHNVEQFFDGSMDATSLLKEWPSSVWKITEFRSVFGEGFIHRYSLPMAVVFATQTVRMILTFDGNTATSTSKISERSSERWCRRFVTKVCEDSSWNILHWEVTACSNIQAPSLWLLLQWSVDVNSNSKWIRAWVDLNFHWSALTGRSFFL